MQLNVFKTVLVTFVSAILGLLCSPFAAVGIVTCWIYSWLVSWKLTHLGLEKMQGLDAYMAQYPDMINMFSLFLTGLPDIEDMRRTTWEKVVQAKDDSGNLMFDKFSKLMEKHYGLWFWSRAAAVYPHNHINQYSGDSPTNENELKFIVAALNSVPLRSCIPQWQITLIPLKGDFLDCGLLSCVVLRKHHSIADGYTFLKLLSWHWGECSCEIQPKNLLGNVKQPSKLSQIFRFVYAMSSLFRIWFAGRVPERNLLHGQQLNNKDFVTWTVFDLNAVKAIKNSTSTTVNDVLLSSLSGAIRKYMIFKNSRVPRSIACIVPMGRYTQNAEFRLENALLILRLCLPTNIKESLQRLKVTKRAFDQLKSSPDIMAVQLGVQFLVPYLPRLLLDWFVTNTNAITIGTSSLAGPNGHIKLFGHHLAVPLAFQPHNGLMGVNITFYGQLDKLYVGFHADTAIIKTQEDLDLIITYLTQELQDLLIEMIPGPVPNIQIQFSSLKNHCSLALNCHKF